MARIVVVHGIAQQHAGRPSLRQSWFTSLCDGIDNADPTCALALREEDVGVAYYGGQFRPPGKVLAPLNGAFGLSDLTEFEEQLAAEWWAEAARTDNAVIAPEAETLGVWQPPVQSALRALSHSRYFVGVTEAAMIGDLVQVRRYFKEPAVRRGAVQAVEKAISEDTRVVIGHSLGSVVAYEALCANPGSPVNHFITLGSPLGIPNLIYRRLDPPPQNVDGQPKARRPGSSALQWTNIADRHDIVALVKRLDPLFDGHVEDIEVSNGPRAHDLSPYLSAPETGRAVINGLTRGRAT